MAVLLARKLLCSLASAANKYVCLAQMRCTFTMRGTITAPRPMQEQKRFFCITYHSFIMSAINLSEASDILMSNIPEIAKPLIGSVCSTWKATSTLHSRLTNRVQTFAAFSHAGHMASQPSGMHCMVCSRFSDKYKTMASDGLLHVCTADTSVLHEAGPQCSRMTSRLASLSLG